MKKIIYRKLLTDCLKFFFLVLFGISTIIWVFQAVNFLDIMIEDGRNYKVYFSYTLLNFPKIISRLLPFALFFSFSYVFIKYETNNELIIFWNHGINKLKIINFFFWVSIIIMLIQIFLLSILVPKSQEIARSKLRSSNIDYFEGLIKPKKFNDTIKGLTIFAEEKNSKDEFLNIYIKKIRSDDQSQITFAKKGVFELKGNKRILVLYNGQTLNNNKGNITNFKFSKSDFGMSNMKSHMIIQQKTQEQPTMLLIECLKIIHGIKDGQIVNCNENNPRNTYKELFKRLISPFYIPLLILISLLLILNSKEKIEYSRYKFSTFALGFLIIILSESSSGYINKVVLKNVFLSLTPILLILFFYLFFLKKLQLNNLVIKK